MTKKPVAERGACGSNWSDPALSRGGLEPHSQLNQPTEKAMTVKRARTLDAATARKPQPQTVQPNQEPRLETAPNAGDVAVTGRGGTLADASLYASYAGQGMEDVSKDEMLVPIMRILQSNSPQCEENHPSGKYMPDAKPGMLYNTATQELYPKEGFDVIFCYRDHNFIEYVPRNNGGGFVAMHDPSEDMIANLRTEQGEFGKLKLDPSNEASNEIVETYYFYGIVHPRLDGTLENFEPFRAVFPFASTQIKKYKMMMTTINGIQLRPPVVKKPTPFPIFAHVWRIGTQPESNKKGRFFGWKAALRGGSATAARLTPNDPMFIDAHDFHQLLVAGAVTPDFGKDQNEEGTDTPAVDNDGNPIPF
jgi:hypothetical protein